MSELLSSNRLFFTQKAKLIELTNEYRIANEDGSQVGLVRQEGQSKAKKLLRAVSDLDRFMTHKLSVYDASGAKVCGLTRPRKFIKSKVLVEDASGIEVGSILQENMVGKIRFSYVDASGEPLGALSAENWRAWNFSITDNSGSEVARITKKWAGVGKELFTTADNYMFEVTGSLEPKLRLLTLASAAGVDLALKQD